MCDVGVCEKELLHKDDFEMSYDDYVKISDITPEMNSNAFFHRGKNFASLITRGARLQAIDDGLALYTAMDWYSGFNIGDGFGPPWIIYKNSGYKVGGHALKIKGYDLPRKVYIIKNSYGEEWGGYVDSQGTLHKGCFAADMDFFDQYGQAVYKIIDIDENIEELLAKYNGQDVKGNGPGIYRIENGIKRPYPDKLTFYAYGGKFGANKTYKPIAQVLLDKTSEGEQMDKTQSPFWSFISERWDLIKMLAEPDNLKEVEQIINGVTNNNMNLAQKYPILGSSVNPDQISATLKSLLPLIVILFAYLKVDVDGTDIDNILTGIALVINTCFTLYYAIRKIIVKFKK